MEKLEYILYCWSEYIRANRIVGVYLLILAASIVLMSIVMGKHKSQLSDTFLTGVTSSTHSKNCVLLILYATIATFVLIIPFSALLLMQFQTVFYSYSTLWLMAAILPVTAFAITLIILSFAKKLRKSTAVIATLLIGIVLFLCGNMGKSTENVNSIPVIRHPVSYEQSLPLLKILDEYAATPEYNGNITILAPANITAYSHMYSGHIHTLYGKDMWDNSMKPLTYNEYPEDYQKLYTWIGCIEVYGSIYSRDAQNPMFYYDVEFEEYEKKIENGQAVGGATYTKLAAECGVDVIVMYNDGDKFDTVTLDYIAETLKINYEYFPLNDVEGYYLVFLAK